MNTKSSRLKPLKEFKDRQIDAVENNEEENVCFYDIKIKNEQNEDISHKLVSSVNTDFCQKSSKLKKKYSSLSSLNQLNETESTLSTSARSSLSSSSNKITTSPSVSSLSSSHSQTDLIMHNFTQTRLVSTSDAQSSLKVEYVPRGKIITINVSIMW